MNCPWSATVSIVARHRFPAPLEYPSLLHAVNTVSKSERERERVLRGGREKTKRREKGREK